MSANMLALNEFVSGALVVALFGIAVLTVVRVVAHVRRHWASKRFMAKYRAAHPLVSRIPAQAPVPLGRLVVRSRNPANVGEPR
jgi:hypothetical protein